MLEYFQLQPESQLPDISRFNPFKAVIIVENSVTPEWQAEVSSWLVKSGCLYMMAWGTDCSSWDDSVDAANLEKFNFNELPEDKSIMTTWHENEPLKEVLWFAKNTAVHPTVELNDTLLLHISNHDKRQELMSEYEKA